MIISADEIRCARLQNQLLCGSGAASPHEAVSHMAAMQAQEFGMAKWAVGLRMICGRDSDVERAFERGQILRTHLLRPTWHFVTPDNIRWLLKLTAPHVHVKNKPYYKKYELDTSTLCRAVDIIGGALQAAPALTRPRLAAVLGANGIEATGLRLSYIMMYAELEGLICSGPRDGKQFTYTLLDSVAPQINSYDRAECIARLANRFFTSRAPASARDFAYWSGLGAGDARYGAKSLSGFETVIYDGQELYFQPASGRAAGSCTFLMPDYDEYGMSYKDRAFLAARHQPAQAPSEYSHWLVLRGRISGTWAQGKGGVDVAPFSPLDETDRAAVGRAVARYLKFAEKTGGQEHGTDE